MTDYDLVIQGAPGASATGPGPNGKDGNPGPDGLDGKEKGKHCPKCTLKAKNGQPGTRGWPPAQAGSGESGGDAPHLTLKCKTFSGQPLRMLFQGGKGGDGAKGGKGGDGGKGGNAGKQPKPCVTKYQDSTGGLGGSAGDGGQGGDAGNGGTIGQISVIWDSRIDQPYDVAKTDAGDAGSAGKGGAAGQPGQGGLNGDGKTRASEGGTASGGDWGATGQSGKNPPQINFDGSKHQPYQLQVTIRLPS